jgi:predicted RND superfamily exporter protein
MTRALLVTIAYSLIAAGAAHLALGLESDGSPTIFLRADDPVRRSYDAFVDTFGSDSFVIVTCRGDTRRAGELAAELQRKGHVVYVPSPGAPVAEALHLLGPGRVSLPVTLRARDALPEVREICDRFGAGIAGGPALNVELEEAADAVGRRIFPILALIMAGLLFVAYRSAKVVALVLVVTVVSLLLGMASIAIAGAAVNLVTILLPVLLLALTVALSVHLVNAYRVHVAAGEDVAAAVRSMVRDELRPCLVTTLTTVAGFGSFALARIDPLAELGRAMAVSILLGFVVCFTLLPALLVLLRPRPREGLNIGDILVRFVPPLVPSRTGAYAFLGAIALATALAVPNVPRETNAIHYLPRDNALRRETDRLAGEGVGSAALELVLRPAPGRPLDDLLPALARIEEEVRQWDVAQLRGVITANTVASEAARLLGPAAAAFALAPAPEPLEGRLKPFRSIDRGAARASILIDPVDVNVYAELRARVDGLLAEAVPPPATWEVTGEFPVVMTVQKELLGTLVSSLVGTAVTILLILALSLRSLRLAALTLLPAVVPLGFVVAACAVLGIPLSISTVMVLGVALGIVTDNSVHMLHAFKEGGLRPALHRVGTAVTETSIAIFLGFAACVLSDFLPTRHFGLLTSAAMLVALVADLLLYPALLRPRAPEEPACIP